MVDRNAFCHIFLSNYCCFQLSGQQPGQDELFEYSARPGCRSDLIIFNGHNVRSSSRLHFQAERMSTECCACSVLVSEPNYVTLKVIQALSVQSANLLLLIIKFHIHDGTEGTGRDFVFRTDIRSLIGQRIIL